MTTVVITGTSAGLGRAMLEQLAGTSHRVIAIARRKDATQDAFKNVQFIMADLASPSELERALATLPTLLAQDVREITFINNAAALGEIAPVGQLSPATIVRTVHVNLISSMLLTNGLAHIARERQFALQVLHVGSGAARKPIAGWSLYCATKAANAMFFKVMVEEGHRAAQIDPGVMDTAMQTQIRSAPENLFPMRAHFVQLQESGQLQDVKQVAAHILKDHGLA